MKIPADNDEGEPYGNSFNIYKLFFTVTLFLMMLWSCKEKKKEQRKIIPPTQDTTLNKEKIKADTIATTKIFKKKIYLTFDDGPNKGSMNVLKAVTEEAVPASFFIVGKHVFETQQQRQAWNQFKADSAIELYNHTYSHALNKYKRYYRHPALVVNDVELNQKELSFSTNVVRMPGRNAWRIDSINRTDVPESKAAIDSVNKAGFDVLGWDLEWTFDYKTLTPAPDTDLLLRQIRNMLETENTKTPGHLVVLAHDQSFQKEASIIQLHYFIQQLKNNPEYELVLVSHYPGIKKDLHRK
jgi:peptidoglycan/xylan/chitin deacetylase (PgdA/CDA1 family)